MNNNQLTGKYFVFVNLAGVLQRHNGCVHSSLNLPQIVAVLVRIHYKPSPAALRYVTRSLATSISIVRIWRFIWRVVRSCLLVFSRIFDSPVWLFVCVLPIANVVMFLGIVFYYYYFRAFSLGHGVGEYHNTAAFYQFVRKTFLSALDSGS